MNEHATDGPVAAGWKIPPRRAGRPAPEDLVARRAAVDAQPVPVEDGVTVRQETYDAVPCVVVEPDDGGAAVTVVYLHGGGYRLGRAAGWADFASRLAVGARARVVLVDYGLAPETPFPGALHDAAVAYAAAVRRHGPVAVGGDSAGGGLALALALAARDSAVPAPTGLVLLSPWLDLTPAAPTYDSNAGTDQLFSRAAANDGAELYLQGHDPRDPLASPLHADLAGLPPILIFAGGAEVLLQDTTDLVARAAAAGVHVRAHLVAGMQHVWPKVFADLPESEAARSEIIRFLTA